MKQVISITLTVLLTLATAIVYAQVPQGIPYQAVARDGAGQPLDNQAVKVRFSILDSLVAGPVVYAETHSVTTSALGLFTANVGMGMVTSGSFTNINWGQNFKFLKVELDTTGSGTNYLNLGTQQMLSVPYAFYAGSAAQSNNASNGLPSGGTQGQSLTICNGVPTWTTAGQCPPAYPAGSVFCSGGPTAVVDVVNPATGKTWMDRNLGATQVATSSTDANSYGDLYQWGRRSDGHQCRNSATTTTLSSTDQPGSGNFILALNTPRDWRSPQNDNLWQGVNGVNNPCPSGYRIPSDAELIAERMSWSQNNSIGAFASPLKWPLAGSRNHGTGTLDDVSTRGRYWSTTVGTGVSRYLIFNTSSANVDTNYRACGFSLRCIKDIPPPTGSINSLGCATATNTGTLTQGVVASGVSSSVPYTGGNGGTHNGQTVTSTGVTGLTATLAAGSFASGAGSLTYTITGTPATSGTATFALNIGGQSCTLSRTVNAPVGIIAALSCATATNTGTLTQGVAASGVSSSVPYTGGNGGTYSGQTVSSTGVTGLTATLAAGSFASGSGSLTYTITGTPASSGTANFALNIGGQSCTLSRTVNAPVGSITALSCATATNTGILTQGAVATGVSSSVPYTGGNGGTHNGQTVTSTGVTGLTATLASGSFVSGSGSLTYTITGTPTSSGTANFVLNIGGQNCTLSRTVNAPVGSITVLSCATATNTGTLTQGVAACGVSSSVPYTGGNGGTHNGQTVSSTGVTGLTATLAAGSFASGAGILTYTISGTPATSGTANFVLNIGGQSCTLSRTVNAPVAAGTYPSGSVYCASGPTAVVDVVNPATGKTWMDRNLGAAQVATSSTDTNSYGDFYQWGRRSDGHQCRNSATTITLSSTDQPTHGNFIVAPNSPFDWRSPQNNNLWQCVNGLNNPCPSGYRIPTEAEMIGELTSWIGLSSIGAFSSPLKLPVAGMRSYNNGFIVDSGLWGYYWSSTVSGSIVSLLYFEAWAASGAYLDRAYGLSVRCLKD